MKRVAIPALTLMLVLGTDSMAIALSDGTYDFYGTWSVDSRDADGGAYACTLELNDMSCPATTSFCIKNLVVGNGGTKIESGDGPPYYGIAIGKMEGTPLTVDPDGVSPVDLTVGGSSNDDLEMSMAVKTPLGGCGGSEACVISWTTGPDPVGGPGGSGTVAGSIGWLVELNPPYYISCTKVDYDHPSWWDPYWGHYEHGNFTTEVVTVRVSNEYGDDQTISETGSPLSGLRLTLKTVNVRYREKIGPVKLETDTMGIVTFDGTLCQPAGSCIPITCPAEYD